MTIRLLAGDVRDVLPTLAADSVHTVVTSPPYWNLRDYQTGTWSGGDAACDHEARANRADRPRNGLTGGLDTIEAATIYRDTCGKCGARRIDRQIGLEATPDEYLATMVAVFREVRRVLHPTGTVFCNMGDSYSDKQLLLMPARLALALQADGWWVRSEITWCKKNPMPESVRDRPANATEKVYLLTKRPRYFYDAIAIAEQTVDVEAVGEYHSSYDTLHNMPDRQGRRGVRQGEARQERQTEGMPLLRYIEDAALASYTGGQAEVDRSGAQIQSDRDGPSEPQEAQQHREAQGGSGGLAPDREGASLPQGVSDLGEASRYQQASLRQRQGEGVDCTLSSDREGQGVVGAWCPQTSGADADNQHAYSCGVEGDQGQRGPQVSLLPQEDGPIDDGPCDPAEQGRPSHSVEHRPGLPELQFQEGQPRNQPALRNARNWWLLATEPFPGSHFATMPTSVVERCIRAGTSERGCCAACGKPWGRIVEKPKPPRDVYTQRHAPTDEMIYSGTRVDGVMVGSGQKLQDWLNANPAVTTGWQPACDHGADVVPCRVLDPFAGAGTTLLVADRLQRDAIGIELNVQYTRMAMDRCIADAPLFTSFPPAEPPEDERMADLFADAAE